MNTDLYMIYDISLETIWWALSNTSLIMWICPVIHKILANKAFTVTNGLISWLFVVAFVHPIYVQIALIWGFPAQLSLWKSVYWLWRYKLNKVCDMFCSGDKVLLDFSDIHTTYLSTKLSHCYVRPYGIKKQVRPILYYLKLSPTL